MRNEWLITFRSVTFAQQAERLFKKEQIPCQLQRTPKMLTSRGCGYCLRLRGKDALYAVALLQEEQITYGKLYELRENGIPEERTL